MASKKFVYPKRAESESWSLNSSQQDQGRKRRLPYKLLSFPSSKCSLWDHTTVGNDKILNLLYQRHPRISIDKTVLRSGHIFIASENKNASQMSCILCGGLLITEDDKQVVITFTKLKFNEEIMKTQIHQQNLAEYQVPVTFSTVKIGEINFHQDFRERAELWLQNTIWKKDTVALNNFIRCKAQCQFENSSNSINCNIQFFLVTLDVRFILKPILPITIILTALSRGLSDPTGNAFLHGEPKSGYVTMDETRRVLLVLDSDPKVTSLPIVGIWIGGVDTVTHPFVWASCIRYMKMRCFGKQICIPPDPFLVLVYEKPTFRPQFYDCILDSSLSKDGFVMYSGSCNSVLDQANVVKPQEVSEILQPNNAQLSFTLKLMEDSTSTIASQKQSLTPYSANAKRKSLSFEGSSSLNKALSPVSAKPAKCLTDICCKCSCKSHESFETPVDPNTADSSKLVHTPRLEREYMTIPLESPTIPNHNIYGLLLAQEQQLKQLKEQLDSLLQGKDAATSSVGCPYRNDSKPLCNKTNSPSRTVTSAGTMTSLAWPPLPSVGNSLQVQHVAIDNNKFIEKLPSPEVERKQALNSESTFLNSMTDSLANLQLPSFEESVESRQSSLVVDLHDYPESHASLSRHSDFSESDLANRSEVSDESSSSVETSGQLNTLASANETEGEWTFYGNLLKKIETILSHQESPDGNMAGSNKLDSTSSTPTHLMPSNDRSSFDSLLIPHLNYVSLLPTDITSDQSLEFCSLALKYLNKCSTPPASCRVFDRNSMTSLLTLCKATENNLSFASRQYLERHGLSSSVTNKQQNPSKTD